jgi:ring-1,2-phenylacetyl-CoA epoxidase subunit PaaC
LWRFTGELTAPNVTDSFLMSYEIAVDLNIIRPIWEKTVSDVLKQATLSAPTQKWMQKGGKEGIHTESLGYILAEMQHLQRTHPNCTW